MIMLILGGIINFVYGLIYYIVTADEDIDERRSLLIIFMTFLLPVVILYVAAYYKWR